MVQYLLEVTWAEKRGTGDTGAMMENYDWIDIMFFSRGDDYWGIHGWFIDSNLGVIDWLTT